jgi:hypothetical protein
MIVPLALRLTLSTLLSCRMTTGWRHVSNGCRLTLCTLIWMLWLRSSRRMATMPQGRKVDVVLYAFAAAQWPHLVYALAHIVGAIGDLMQPVGVGDLVGHCSPQGCPRYMGGFSRDGTSV